VQSDKVAIGNFTALLEVTPVSIIAGQDVIVRMRVYNNSGGTLGTVRPSTLGFVGDASIVSFSGPSPPVVPSLPDGSTTTFEWTYTLTGTVGSTYAFTGTASAQGPRVANVARSNGGAISQYSAYVTPRRVGSGTATPLDLVFTVANNGGATIEKFEFVLPSGFTDSGGGGETVGSVGVPCTWNYDTGSDDFESAAGSCGSGGLPSGGTAVLTITFSSIPSPDVETEYDFHIDFCKGSQCTTGSGLGKDWQGAVDVPFTITPYRIEMEADPPSLPADGFSTSVVTATVYMGSNPVPNADIVFATTGTEGTLSAYGGTTDVNGVITVAFTAPVGFVDSQAIIIATYLTAEGQVTIDLIGVEGPNPLYVGGTLNPLSVEAGDTVTFTLDVINTGNQPVTLITSSTFTFTDSMHTFTATLATGTAIPTDTQCTLTFTAATVDSNFAAGDYYPALHLVSADGPAYDRPVSDKVSVVVWPVYEITARAGSVVIRVLVRMVHGLPVILSWEILP
ncbi:MAG: Ig-like domain-containing protein, partial [Chloroflexi bacterium]|nr:Ig-like domain-containing protein [Chloroflexota bacterium]